ncbi:MAG: hypothetical protein K6G05_05100 [Lachnospiraceae bacterium]|nr:hypothetical protein [Lachnospiraceae bacterium]
MICKQYKKKILGMMLGAICTVSVLFSGVMEVQAATPSELSAGTYSVNASLTASVANHGDFGQAVYSSAFITKKSNGNTYITVNFKSSAMTIYGITTDVFVDVNPGGGTTRGVSDGILGIYLDGKLTTSGVTYVLSGDTAMNANGESVPYVESATFPVNDGASSYNLALYISSNTMGVEFCNANSSATAATYPATLSIDWNSIDASSSSSSTSSSTSAGNATAGTSQSAASGSGESTESATAEDGAEDSSDASTEDLVVNTTSVSEESGLTVYETSEDTSEDMEEKDNTALLVIMAIGALAVLGGAGYLGYRKIRKNK